MPVARQSTISKTRAFLAGLLVREQESELSTHHPPSAVLAGLGGAALRPLAGQTGQEAIKVGFTAVASVGGLPLRFPQISL